MKTILITCLLGIAMLFNETATAETAKSAHRMVDVNKEDLILYITSQQEEGYITRVQIFNSSYVMIYEKTYADYAVEVDVTDLESGNYSVKVFTQYAPVYTDYFTR